MKINLIIIVSVLIFTGCMVNTQKGKCLRDVDNEQAEEGEPCFWVLIGGLLVDGNSQSSSAALNNFFLTVNAAQCMELETRRSQCENKSSWIPVLQEPRTD